uniref:Uncharacterized protein n=1 Tax=Setaria italica TaxID=4555 RepID=K3Z1T8_SETIT
MPNIELILICLFLGRRLIHDQLLALKIMTMNLMQCNMIALHDKELTILVRIDWTDQI